eukprot:gene37734-44077_t
MRCAKLGMLRKEKRELEEHFHAVQRVEAKLKEDKQEPRREL